MTINFTKNKEKPQKKADDVAHHPPSSLQPQKGGLPLDRRGRSFISYKLMLKPSTPGFSCAAGQAAPGPGRGQP